MGVSDFQIIEFQKEQKLLDLNTFNNDIEKYNQILGLMEINEFNKGFIIKKVNKPTKNGTKITFKAIKSDKEYEMCYLDITTRLAYLIKPNK